MGWGGVWGWGWGRWGTKGGMDAWDVGYPLRDGGGYLSCLSLYIKKNSASLKQLILTERIFCAPSIAIYCSQPKTSIIYSNFFLAELNFLRIMYVCKALS